MSFEYIAKIYIEDNKDLKIKGCLTLIQPDTRDIQMSLVGQRRPALPRTNSAVPSALGGLTSGFGMGPGVPPLPKSLTNEGHSIINQST